MMKKRYKVALLFLVLGIGVLVTACATLNSPQFGKLPEQARLERIQQSPNYINDEFAYPEPTPMLREGESTLKIFGTTFGLKNNRRNLIRQFQA